MFYPGLLRKPEPKSSASKSQGLKKLPSLKEYTPPPQQS